jgi:iron(III) transport system ATP-binding protein
VIAGIESIDSGRIALAGEVASGGDTFVEPEHRQIGFMFQDYALFPHLTAVQNIGFGLRKMSREAARRRVGDVIELLGIAALADRYPHQLSGGEQQRVALARALAPQPKLLLMDEPFSNLDRGLRDGIRRQTLGLIRQLGISAIMVTHDPEEALAIGDQVVLMRQGKVVEVGTGQSIYSTPHTPYAAGFFSAVNKLPGTCSDGWIDSALGRFPAGANADGNVTIFVQPRAITVADAGGIPALVHSRAQLGEIEEWTFALDGIEHPIVMRTTDRHNIAIGDRVHIRVAPQDVSAFPSDVS